MLLDFVVPGRQTVAKQALSHVLEAVHHLIGPLDGGLGDFLLGVVDGIAGGDERQMRSNRPSGINHRMQTAERRVRIPELPVADDAELIPSRAVAKTVRDEAGLQRACHNLQNLVTEEVSEKVIALFEAVDVDVDNRSDLVQVADAVVVSLPVQDLCKAVRTADSPFVQDVQEKQQNRDREKVHLDRTVDKLKQQSAKQKDDDKHRLGEDVFVLVGLKETDEPADQAEALGHVYKDVEKVQFSVLVMQRRIEVENESEPGGKTDKQKIGKHNDEHDPLQQPALGHGGDDCQRNRRGEDKLHTLYEHPDKQRNRSVLQIYREPLTTGSNGNQGVSQTEAFLLSRGQSRVAQHDQFDAGHGKQSYD